MPSIDSRHLVDPELHPLLDVVPTLALSDETLHETRRAIAEMAVPPEPDNIKVERREVPGPDGAPDVPIYIYLPDESVARPLGCILHIHGGGYVAGTAAGSEAMLRSMAGRLGCAIVSVDYRLCPENPHPAPVEDCYAGLAWTFRNAAELGIDTKRIGVTGESAGGGLAAGLALLARDRGEFALAFQLLTYPMLDDRQCVHPDPHPLTGEFVWNAESNRFGWSALLGHEPGIEGVSPYAAPARAEDLSGLPPTFIGTAALDLFMEEDLEYARRLTRAGVPMELHVWPGAFHAFDMSPDAGVSQAANAARMAAFARFLKG